MKYKSQLANELQSELDERMSHMQNSLKTFTNAMELYTATAVYMRQTLEAKASIMETAARIDLLTASMAMQLQTMLDKQK